MPCFRPIHGYRAVGGKVVFKKSASIGIPMTVPCGQCIGCRLDKQRDWSARILHEGRLHPHTVFLTLTYSDESLPPGGTLCLRHWQLFMKRLRKHYAPHPYRFIANGEYGDRTQRPHYHAILYNHVSVDRKLWQRKDHGSHVYEAPTLTKLWGMGLVTEQDFDPSFGDYIAQHCVKRLSRERAAPLLQRVDPLTGETWQVEPEFWVMSRRPGIGHGYYEKFKDEIWKHDSIIYKGAERSVPGYYDQLRLRENEPRMLKVKDKRMAEARTPKRKANNTPARLEVRENVTRARLNLKRKRSL